MALGNARMRGDFGECSLSGFAYGHVCYLLDMLSSELFESRKGRDVSIMFTAR